MASEAPAWVKNTVIYLKPYPNNKCESNMNFGYSNPKYLFVAAYKYHICVR